MIVVLTLVVALFLAFMLGWRIGELSGYARMAGVADLKIRAASLGSEVDLIMAKASAEHRLSLIDGLLRHINGTPGPLAIEETLYLGRWELDKSLQDASS